MTKYLFLLLLLLATIHCQERGEQVRCSPVGDCNNCVENSIDQKECSETGWVQENLCITAQDGEEIKRQLVVLSCLAPSTAQVAEMSHGKALVLFFCLTGLSTIVMLMRRRSYFYRRSFRNTFNM